MWGEMAGMLRILLAFAQEFGRVGGIVYFQRCT
jgi:hypothetical protein